MIKAFQIEEIVDSPSKVAILRLLTARKNFKTTGRQIAKLIGYSAPSTHDSLKDLHSRNILKLDIIGKQHIYTLNEEDRIVKKIIHPMFAAESNIKSEIRNFLLKEFKRIKIKAKIASLILYGSMQTETAKKGSDIDVAVVVSRAVDLNSVENVFLSEIAPRFKAYFGVQLDSYIKSSADFRQRLKKNQPPVSTLMKSYSVLYGKEPLEI
ncbi:MAG: nucleotidyltransferase domain-containing protein [Elusimicrobia bacterium]|jgi:DNA polymerase sigma|nr:nucleotidyltransferase domain-containing protein [Elusimicrobiota bacterium]